MWSREIEWDEEIPEDLQNKLDRWEQELKKLDLYEIPRCLIPKNVTGIMSELHIFVDSCEISYACVAYL